MRASNALSTHIMPAAALGRRRHRAATSVPLRQQRRPLATAAAGPSPSPAASAPSLQDYLFTNDSRSVQLGTLSSIISEAQADAENKKWRPLRESLENSPTFGPALQARAKSLGVSYDRYEFSRIFLASPLRCEIRRRSEPSPPPHRRTQSLLEWDAELCLEHREAEAPTQTVRYQLMTLLGESLRAQPAVGYSVAAAGARGGLQPCSVLRALLRGVCTEPEVDAFAAYLAVCQRREVRLRSGRQPANPRALALHRR